MWLVKYATPNGIEYRSYKWKTEQQVRAIANALFKSGWQWITMTKEW